MGMNEIVKKAGELVQEVGKTTVDAGQKLKDEAKKRGFDEMIIIDSDKEKSLKNVSMISYALHTIVAVAAVVPGMQPSALLLIISFVLDLWKKGDANGTWLESHFTWRIRTVVWAMVLYAVTSPLWLFFIIPGWIAWGLISLWFLYRIVRGFIALGDRKPMPV